MTKIEECDELSGEVLTTNTFVFDANERLTSKTYGAVGHTYRPIYEKNASGYIYPDNEVMGITLDGKFTDKVTKDGLRRVSAKTFAIGNSTLFEDTYGYLSTPKDSKTIATEIVSSVSSHVYGTSANFETLNYTYDKAGNLETVKRGSELIAKYYYDGLNRLKREDNYSANKTYIWSYDVGGNILFKKEYALCADVNLGECLDTKSCIACGKLVLTGCQIACECSLYSLAVVAGFNVGTAKLVISVAGVIACGVLFYELFKCCCFFVVLLSHSLRQCASVEGIVAVRTALG